LILNIKRLKPHHGGTTCIHASPNKSQTPTQHSNFPDQQNRLLSLLPPTLLHHQNLHEPDKDIQEVQLQADTLIDGISLDEAPFGLSSMEQDALHIIKSEAPEDGQATIEPDVLRESESADGGGGEDERGETRNGDDGYARKQRTAEVEVFLLLGCCADEGDGAHHCNGVEAGAGDDGGWRHEEERRDEGGLSDVEAGPESVLLDVVARICSSRANHRSKAETQTTKRNDPRIRSHQSVHKATLQHGPGRDANDSHTEASMKERLIQVRPLINRHTAIFTSLAIEDEIHRDQRAGEHGATDKQFLDQTAAGLWLRDRLLDVGSRLLFEGISKEGNIFDGSGAGGTGCEEGVCVLRALVESSGGEGGFEGCFRG